jgi:hypothetical protein
VAAPLTFLALAFFSFFIFLLISDLSFFLPIIRIPFRFLIGADSPEKTYGPATAMALIAATNLRSSRIPSSELTVAFASGCSAAR